VYDGTQAQITHIDGGLELLPMIDMTDQVAKWDEEKGSQKRKKRRGYRRLRD